MLPRQIRKYYGTPTKFAAQTGYTRVVLYQWEERGFVPKRAQIVVSAHSGQALKVGPPFEARKP